MDRIQELLAKLGELTADELNELSQLIAAEVDAIAAEEPSVDTADALTALADAHDQVVAETERRDAEQAEIAARHAEQLARLRPVDDAATDTDDAGDEADDVEVDDAADPDQPEAVAAAGAPVTRPTLADIARRRPAARSPRTRQAAEPQRAALVAAADVSGYTAGQEFASLRDLATAFERRRASIGKSSPRGDGEQVLVASARYAYPEDRRLARDVSVNTDRVEAVTSPQAIVAAGGLCAPIENLYEVEVLGVTDRPVRDSLAGFQATRGGVSLRPAQQFQDWDAAVGEWTLATDANPGASTKAVLDVLCATFDDFQIGAVTLGLNFHNITARTDPEGTAANIAAGNVAFSRFAENRLLLAMAASCTQLTGATVHGAARDLLMYLDRTIAYYRNRHRLSDQTRLRTWLPRWVKDMIRADLVQGAPGDLEALAVADSVIEGFFTARGVNVTWHLDGRVAAVAGQAGPPVVNAIAAQSYPVATNTAAVPAFPAQVEQIIAREGDFLFLDGGELDLGVVRDSTLNSTNEYQMFYETFEGVAFRGAEAIQLVSTVVPNGTYA